MNSNISKYLWYTDTHLDIVPPWTKIKFISHIVREKPKGIFLTGDISNGLLATMDLNLLASFAECPIYFVLGNHDYHFSSFEKTHDKIRNLCEKRSNLIWLTESNIIPLKDDVALIGTEGWYDAKFGNTDYLKLTMDWFFIKEFRKMPSMEDRIDAFRDLSYESAYFIREKIEKCIEQNYKTIYILTHFPPWKEATRDFGTFLEFFWLPYNTNITLGKAIEKAIEHTNVQVKVLAGHTHSDSFIQINNNIECKVNAAKYYDTLRNEEIIFI